MEPEQREVRLFAVSDIHTDIAQNFAWVEQLSRTAFAAFFLVFFARDTMTSASRATCSLRRSVR